MVRTKVFVGNLSFATKENELAKEFETAGKVISANIITRGPRSLGYGFVEMDNEADAENAVKLLNKKEIDGRPINVEVAKPREEGAEEQKQQGGNGGRGGRGGRGRGGRGGFSSRGGPRGGASRGGRGGSSEGGNEGGNFRRRFRRREGSDEEGEEQTQNGNRRRGGSRGGRGSARGAARGGQQQRPRRDSQQPDTRAPSQTTLFVANLPFSLDDDSFAKILKEANLAFKSAYVVKKKSQRSKGYGFVEFENEGDQQKALAALNTKQVEGRELVVKVALTETKTEGNTNAPSTTEETKQPTTTTTTTTEQKPATPTTPSKTEQKK